MTEEKKITRIYWKDDEREKIVAHIIDSFATEPFENWIVTYRRLFAAQLHAVPENRFRSDLAQRDIDIFQELVQAYIESKSKDALFNRCEEFRKHYGHSVFDALSDAETQVIELLESVRVLTEERDLARSLPAYKAAYPEPKKATGRAAAKRSIFVYAPRLTDTQRRDLEDRYSVVWGQLRDNPQRLGQMAAGLPAFMMRQSAGIEIKDAVKASAQSFTVVPGSYSALSRAITEELES